MVMKLLAFQSYIAYPTQCILQFLTGMKTRLCPSSSSPSLKFHLTFPTIPQRLTALILSFWREKGEKQDCKTKRIEELFFSGHIYLPCSFQFLLVLLPENNKEIAELRKTIKRKGRRILLHIIGKQFRMNKKYFQILSFHFVMTMFHTSYLGLMVVLTSWNEKLRQYVASNKDSWNHYVLHSFWCIGNILFCR